MRQRFHIISALLVLAMSTMAGAAGHGRADAPPIARPRTAVVPPFISAIDTMKESRDTETRPLSDAAIADDVNLAASLNPNYITVDTHFEYPDYMARWVAAIRATGRHVWFRIHPNQWGDNNGTTGIMTPAQYESAEQAFLQANLALFQPGDILDPCPEPENGTYWLATYGSGWTANAPNPATEEYNAFIRATSDIADSVLQGAGIYGVITTVRSTNSFFATHPGPLEAATVARLGRVTVDSYPDQNLTDPAQAAAARVSEYRAIYAAWGVPVVVGEMGYSNKIAVDDATQQSVLSAEFGALETLPFLEGLNYWVGAGTDNSGGYTHIFSGSNGNWALRPAASDLAGFFADEQGRVGTATPVSPSATDTPTLTSTALPTTATDTPTAAPSSTATLASTSTATPTDTATSTASTTPTATLRPVTSTLIATATTPPAPTRAVPTPTHSAPASATPAAATASPTFVLPKPTGVAFAPTPTLASTATARSVGTSSPTATVTNTPPAATPGTHRHKYRHPVARHSETHHRTQTRQLPRTRRPIRQEILE